MIETRRVVEREAIYTTFFFLRHCRGELSQYTIMFAALELYRVYRQAILHLQIVQHCCTVKMSILYSTRMAGK